MSNAIWVLGEIWKEKITEATYEALALGLELAQATEAPLEAVLIGRQAKELAKTLGAAARVLAVEDERAAEPVPGVMAEVLAWLAREKQPAAILAPYSNLSMIPLALAAARLKAPLVTSCADARAEGGRFIVKSELCGGKLVAELAVEGEPALLGLKPGMRQQEKGRADRTPEIEEITGVPIAETRVRWKRYLEPETTDVDLKEMPVLVGVGRGMQTKDNLELAEELAQELGGAVCGSRPVIDQGWLPLARQVGKSGQTVKPRLYIALGISGAPEHVEGMRNSEVIVAVNTDPQAPIFRVAHYGIAGDALEFAPALAEAVKAKKGHPTHA